MLRSLFVAETAPAIRVNSVLPQCGACGYYKACRTPKISVSGAGKRKLLVVGRFPDDGADRAGAGNRSNAAETLRTVAGKYGYRLDKDAWWTDAMICKPAGKTKVDQAVDYCRPNLIKTVQELKPKVILLLGSEAVMSFFGWVWKPGEGGIYRFRGYRVPNRKTNAWVVPTWHPTMLLQEKDPVLDRQFQEDVKAALEFAHPGSSRPYPADNVPPETEEDRIEVVKSTERAAIRVRILTERAKRRGLAVAFDFETTCLKPDGPASEIVSCAVCFGGEDTIAYPWDRRTAEATKELLEDPAVPKVGANCFSGDTKFLTREHGVVRLDKMAGKRVTVLNHHRKWVTGEVRSFGKQITEEVTFCRRNSKTTVRATPGHRWLDVSGTEYRTDELKHKRWGSYNGKADQIPFLSAPRKITNKEDYEKGVRHGIVYGDGNKLKQRPNTYRVRLCGPKSALLPFFRGFPVSYQPSAKGDPTVHLSRQKVNLKELPPRGMSDNYLIGFARGLLATDGCVATNGQIHISNKKECVSWCRKYLPRVGYLFQGVTDYDKYTGKHEGQYVRNFTTYSLYLTRETVTEDDLLLMHHRDNYCKIDRGAYRFNSRSNPRKEEVYCVVVPEGESFTLDNGLVTGNCKFEYRFALANGIRVRGWAWDVNLTAHAIWNNSKVRSITAVDFQACVELGVAGWDAEVHPFLISDKGKGCYQPNRIRQADLNKVLLYNGLDALYEYQIYLRQLGHLGMTRADAEGGLTCRSS